MKYVLILILASIGCVTAPTEDKYKAVLNSWVNSPADNLIQVWGPPTQTYTLDNGDKILTYDKSNGSAFVGALAVPINCKTSFVISEGTHKIKNWSYEGNACKAN